MVRRPPGVTGTDTLFPSTPLSRSESVIADRAEIGAAVVPIIVPRPDRAIEPIAALGEQRRRRGADAVTARPIEARAHPERRYDRVGKQIGRASGRERVCQYV